MFYCVCVSTLTALINTVTWSYAETHDIYSFLPNSSQSELQTEPCSKLVIVFYKRHHIFIQ